MLEGWAAKLTEPFHWAIYGAGAYGFWQMKPWMWPWAAVYVLQIAISMLVWTGMNGSLIAGAISFFGPDGLAWVKGSPFMED